MYKKINLKKVKKLNKNSQLGADEIIISPPLPCDSQLVNIAKREKQYSKRNE